MESSWQEYQRVVLFRLDEHSRQLDVIQKKVEQLQYFKSKVIGWSAGLAFISSGLMTYFWR